jgi:hypothetical protein
MIYINHSKKAIFIHIPKNGGTYIGTTLVNYYGFNCYLDKLIKRRPDHDIICHTDSFPKILTGNKLYDNAFYNRTIGLLVYCKTSDYLNALMNMNKEKWETYTKFCFVRNPYSRVLSGWKHMKISLKLSETLDEYISDTNVTDIEYGHVFMTQKKQIEDEDGNCGVDIIGRFEHLEEDFQEILFKIGFNQIIHKNIKKNVSNEKSSNAFAYETKTVEKINKIFEDDFKSFHYIKINLLI